MDKPKESKVRTRVMEILRNHDQEARVIEAQIAAEKEALEAARSATQKAQIDLFTATNQYDWAVRGVVSGS